MASLSDHHRTLTNSVGKCSVPMWSHGCPAGFCDEPAYGERPECDQYRDAFTGELKRVDGRYNGYLSSLACPAHGGPEKPDLEKAATPSGMNISQGRR